MTFTKLTLAVFTGSILGTLITGWLTQGWPLTLGAIFGTTASLFSLWWVVRQVGK